MPAGASTMSTTPAKQPERPVVTGGGGELGGPTEAGGRGVVVAGRSRAETVGDGRCQLGLAGVVSDLRVHRVDAAWSSVHTARMGERDIDLAVDRPR